MSSRSNSQFVVASVTEFLSVWAHGGKSSLNLSTSGGLTTVNFTCTLGHPGASHSIPAFSPPPSPPTSSPSRRPRHRGPAQKEKHRLRAARHQAAQAEAAAPAAQASPVTATAPTSPSLPVILNNSKLNTVSTHVSSKHVTASVMSMSSLPSSKGSSDELSCDICNFQGVSSNGLKIHKGRKHDNIPQVDGEASQERETDCWWERNLSHRLKTYQVYKDVLLDIDESTLSEEEKLSERENVTNLRKEGLGSNYIYCPPWSS